MMGQTDEQKQIFRAVQIEQLVPADHPLRKIRLLVDTQRIRELCREFYCENNGRPGIPPEQLFLAILGGYLLGIRSDRKLIIVLQCNMAFRSDRKLIIVLQCNMAFRWFVGLNINSPI